MFSSILGYFPSKENHDMADAFVPHGKIKKFLVYNIQPLHELHSFQFTYTVTYDRNYTGYMQGLNQLTYVCTNLCSLIATRSHFYPAAQKPMGCASHSCRLHRKYTRLCRSREATRGVCKPHCNQITSQVDSCIQCHTVHSCILHRISARITHL